MAHMGNQNMVEDYSITHPPLFDDRSYVLELLEGFEGLKAKHKALKKECIALKLSEIR